MSCLVLPHHQLNLLLVVLHGQYPSKIARLCIQPALKLRLDAAVLHVDLLQLVVNESLLPQDQLTLRLRINHIGLRVQGDTQRWQLISPSSSSILHIAFSATAARKMPSSRS